MSKHQKKKLRRKREKRILIKKSLRRLGVDSPIQRTELGLYSSNIQEVVEQIRAQLADRVTKQ